MCNKYTFSADKLLVVFHPMLSGKPRERYLLFPILNPRAFSWEFYTQMCSAKWNCSEIVKLFASLGKYPWSRSAASCCIYCSLEKPDLINARQCKMPLINARQVPQCHQPVPPATLLWALCHTEAPCTSRMGTWSFSYGRLEIDWDMDFQLD